MGFYAVWVRSLGYRGKKPLTYHSNQKLIPGTIVQVPLQRERVLGFIENVVSKPTFTAKEVSKVYALPPLPDQIIQLTRWLQVFYASPLGVAATQVLPAALSEKNKPQAPIIVNKALPVIIQSLTVEQQSVVENISKPDTYLLHGRTGSGKTRIYLELATKAVRDQNSALILTPEISLTSQLAQSFRAAFGERVIILHSQLRPLERQKAWLRILTTEVPLVIIGARSALFSPIKHLGLIVLDEAHEPAYKQEQAPYYHARSVASKLAQLHSAILVIGSATPSITDYSIAEQRGKPILSMNALAQSGNIGATHITTIDLKDRSLFSRSAYLSQPLLESMQAALKRGEQSLVYLNRRGTARIVLCENCGWQALCPHCDLPLVYHADSGRFRCHTCGFSQHIVTGCPVCSNPSVTFKSWGTKAITDEIQRLFPEARVQRFDTDNTKAERFEQHFTAVKNGEIDILVGTQLLAKGLDLPKLSVLGIVLADSSLSIPDFSSGERTYQLLSQALGRIGRGHTTGSAFVQTYHPESPIIQAAIRNDWQKFYTAELAERQKFHFPPFSYLLKLSCRRATYASAEAAAKKLKIQVEQQLEGIEIDGPAPSFHEKSQGKYQCQLIVRSKHRSQLLAAIKLLPASGWSYDIDPINLL